MRKILCTLLCACVLLSLAACSPKADQPETTAAPVEPITVPQTQPEATQAPTETETTEPITEAEPEGIRPLTLEKSLHTYFEWVDELPFALVRSEHSTVTLAGEDAKRYPEMAQVLEEIAVLQEKTMLKEFDNLVSFARDDLSWGSEGFDTYVSTLDVQVRRADSTVISLLSDSYADYAHFENLRIFHGSNYDTQTGRELMINEVVNVNNDLALAVEKELLAQMYAETFYSEYAVQNYFADTPYDGFSWTLDYTGITFYFAPGHFCEGGAMSATVTFAEYPELFVEKYAEAPREYTAELSMDQSFFADLDGDGDQEAVSVFGCYDNERNCYLDFGVYTDSDGCWYEEYYANTLRPYYVKTEDGHYIYLFFEFFYEGWREMELMVLSLNPDGSVTKVGTCDVSPAWQADNRFRIPTDPVRFLLDDTDRGETGKTFCVGEDGMPSLRG